MFFFLKPEIVSAGGPGPQISEAIHSRWEVPGSTGASLMCGERSRDIKCELSWKVRLTSPAASTTSS